MSECLERLEDSERRLRIIKAIKRLPVVYHPDSVFRRARNGLYYKTGLYPWCSDVVPEQPQMDISLLKIDAVIAEGAVAHEANRAAARLRLCFKEIPPLSLPPSSGVRSTGGK